MICSIVIYSYGFSFYNPFVNGHNQFIFVFVFAKKKREKVNIFNVIILHSNVKDIQ